MTTLILALRDTRGQDLTTSPDGGLCVGFGWRHHAHPWIQYQRDLLPGRVGEGAKS